MEEKIYEVTSGDKVFPASEYQAEIFKTIEHGVGNLIINACAGSSKTTTLVNAMKYIPDNKKVLFVAFNKDIVAEIQSRINRDNVTVSTFHSLGYSILRENKVLFNDQELSRVRTRVDLELKENICINIFKYINRINNEIINSYDLIHNRSIGKQKNLYINNIKKLIDYSRFYLAFSKKEIENVAKIYDIIPIRDEIDVVRNLLIFGKDNLDSIDYTDMLWLPNVLNLTTKKHLYDWVFIDEAQDTSIVEQQLIEKTFKRGTRFVAVGDNFQCINIFAGSTEQAIDLLKKHPHTKELMLPITYRCPKNVVNLAKNYSPNIIAAPNAIDGEINDGVSIMEPSNGDMVLCRNTAPLIGLYMRYLQKGKKAFLIGSEGVKEKYLSLIEQFKSTLIDRNCITSDGLIPKLYSHLLSEIERCKNNYGLIDDDVFSHPSILSLYDDIDGLLSLSIDLTNVEELIDKINTVFEGDDTNAIRLSTIHKSKGLEADNVFILCPSLLPSKLAKKDWEIRTERNLIYVAYTRAKKTLNFLSETDYNGLRPSYHNSESIKKKLENIKKKIIFNTELGVSEKNYDGHLTKNSGTTITLGQKKNEDEPIINKQKKVKSGIKFKNLLS